jgi:hypothetical protein
MNADASVSEEHPVSMFNVYTRIVLEGQAKITRKLSSHCRCPK